MKIKLKVLYHTYIKPIILYTVILLYIYLYKRKFVNDAVILETIMRFEGYEGFSVFHVFII